MIVPNGNCAKYGCSSLRTTPGISQYRCDTAGTIVSVITAGRVKDDNLRSQIKHRTLNA